MKKISFEELNNINPYKKIAKDWFLLSAGTKDKGYNTMTASWGHMGSLWGHGGGKSTAIVFVRPTRYTKEFVDNNEYFSLSFFEEEYRKDLSYLGTVSGRDENKIFKTSLEPIFDDKCLYFKQANLVLICRKLYKQELKEECFIDHKVCEDSYPLKDFHTMYIGEIVETLVRE